jgi:hypothetical protein
MHGGAIVVHDPRIIDEIRKHMRCKSGAPEFILIKGSRATSGTSEGVSVPDVAQSKGFVCQNTLNVAQNYKKTQK